MEDKTRQTIVCSNATITETDQTTRLYGNLLQKFDRRTYFSRSFSTNNVDICWPAHQFCLCCGRNTAEGCRKWSRSTGEYDYNRACWSSCALCSDDAYKILNTPIIFKEKIIDPELLLPLDAELLYYSIQSAKLRKERQQNSSAKTESPKKSKFALPFSKKMKGLGSLFGKKKRSRKAESSRSAPRKKKKKKKKKSKRKSSRSKRRSRSKSKRSKKRSKSKPKKSNKHSRRKSNRSKKRSQSKSRR